MWDPKAYSASVVSIFIAIELCILVAVIVERLEEKKKPVSQKDVLSATAKSYNSSFQRNCIDDLFASRCLLLVLSILQQVFAVVGWFRTDQNAFECQFWISLSSFVLYTFAKGILHLFLYGKQRVLRAHLSIPVSREEKTVLTLIQFMPVSGLIGAIFAKFDFDAETGICKVNSSIGVMTAISLASILDFVISFWLLKMFLNIIRDNLQAAHPVGHTRTASVGSAPRSPSSKDLKNKDGSRLMKIMLLNKRTCVACVVSFLMAMLVASITITFGLPQSVSGAINTTFSTGDLLVDCIAMVACSPKILKILLSPLGLKVKQVTEGRSSTHDTDGTGPENPRVHSTTEPAKRISQRPSSEEAPGTVEQADVTNV